MCYVSTIMQQVHLCVDTCLLLNPSRGLYVGGLTDSLANISEEELKKLFSPFGEIEFIDLHRDPYTNKCKGFAFVQFKNASEAREAMTAMNGFQLAGKELKVGIATSDMQLGEGAGGANNLAIGGENLHEDASAMGPNASQPGMLKDANDRLALMQKLQRDTLPGYGGPGVPSNIIVLHGMFNPSQVNLAADPEFFNDIHADVEQECRKAMSGSNSPTPPLPRTASVHSTGVGSPGSRSSRNSAPKLPGQALCGEGLAGERQ
eukprot:s4939_g4.t1